MTENTGIYIHFTSLAYAPEHMPATSICMSLYTNKCSLLVDPKLLHIQLKTTNSNFIYHAITIYVPTTNMPLKC